jgi:hypothetical protein
MCFGKKAVSICKRVACGHTESLVRFQEGNVEFILTKRQEEMISTSLSDAMPVSS